MTDTASPISQSSALMWLLATLTAVLAIHVAHGWVRRARARGSVRDAWRTVLLAAGSIGSGLCAATVLSLTAETMGFPLGYRAIYAPALWLASMVAAVPVVWAMASSVRWWTLAATGMALACVAAAVHAGWMLAAGFLPGLYWRLEYVATALLLMTVACSIGLWAALSNYTQDSNHRRLWRAASAVFMALGLMAGAYVLMVAGGLGGQVGSAWLRQVPGSLLSLLCVLVPLGLALMELDLYLRRPRRRHSELTNRFAPRRRRRRHRSL